MNVQIETITPKKAKQILEHSEGFNFRVLDHKHSQLYSTIMEQGDWELTGQTIQLDEKGRCVDGQHRLSAIYKSGITQKFIVVRGVKCSPLHIDKGKRRTVAQYLHHKKIKNYQDIASMGKLIVGHDKGLWAMHTGNAGITDDEIVRKVFDNLDKMQDSLTVVKKSLPGLGRGVAAAICFLSSKENEMPSENETIEWFWTAFRSGEKLAKTDPVYHLRKKIIESQSNLTKRLDSLVARTYATICWNKTASGEEMQRLNLSFTGPKKTIRPTKVSLAP